MEENTVRRTNPMRRNFIWFIGAAFVIIFVVYLFNSSGMGKISTDFAQAYADDTLYENAIELANSNGQVQNLLGEIQPIDRMTILNGEVQFSEDNETVSSTIKVTGSKGKAKMDLLATRNNEEWDYKKIILRINSEEKEQVIKIVSEE